MPPPAGDDDADSSGGGDDSSRKTPRRRKNRCTFSWDANDPNGDGMIFRLYYKQVTPDGTDLWTPLARDFEGDPTYEWDTRAFPMASIR